MSYTVTVDGPEGPIGIAERMRAIVAAVATSPNVVTRSIVPGAAAEGGARGCLQQAQRPL